ncbi:MAG: hypothetical protein J6M30_06325 [Bacteroidales bacterium]|nr:hypothetical protein [Bacteroidales bacterium]
MITSDALMQGVYLNVPVKDWNFFKELIVKWVGKHKQKKNYWTDLYFPAMKFPH